ncbi:MAG: asparagine synthetase B, partial [Lentisphaeraceae bacterium]|nr:asparagine synthetase B [Lentisphaeraceae bacterium]
MCGIFGFYLKESLDEEDISLGVSGVNALKHRGPDNQNYWYNAEHGIFLGHTRLSILDISEKSNQPMIDSEHVMVYNGEIYNYKEISKGLSSGEYLKSTGDTEVLFNCWKEYGEKCLAKLDGMYAFAVYNKRERTLDLFSDYFGEKPLYWFESNKGIYFSSELNPLVKLLAISSDFSESDVSAFLSFGFMPGQRTGYKQTKALEPASHLRIEDSGSYNLKKYWTPQERIIENTSTVKPLAEKDIDLFQDALLESLQVRLRSDVPLGLFLSSGLDSSVIASLAKKELNFDIECLTVKFNDPEVSDESAMASKIALFLDLPHKIIDSKDDPARKDRNVIYDLFGEANNNITIAAAYQMSLAAR